MHCKYLDYYKYFACFPVFFSPTSLNLLLTVKNIRILQNLHLLHSEILDFVKKRTQVKPVGRQ